MRTAPLLLSALALAAAPARAADWIVDAAGAASTLTTIDQAMAVAAPGDRILVLPGSYPAFQFSRGVEVIGLGTSPSQVQVARVDFHVSLPITGYDAALSNVAVCGEGPADGMSLGGNELAAGTFVVDGVTLCGGVFLRGVGDFYLLMSNCSIHADPGDGFLGAALDVGGATVDLVDTQVWGAPASPALGLAAGVGLRLGAGARVRVSESEVVGGAGAAGGAAALAAGGAGIEPGWGAGARTLRLAGRSLVRGGDAAASGPGGAAVAIQGTIEVGQATVAGGAGGVAGAAYAASQPVQLSYDPWLDDGAAPRFGQGDAFLRPGARVLLAPDASLNGAVLVVATRLDPATSALASPIPRSALTVWPGATMGYPVPPLHAPGGIAAPLARRYVQAFFRDPHSGELRATNPVALTLAP